MKQLIYADRMGLKLIGSRTTPYVLDVRGRILDIGGGPCSLLLKCSRTTIAKVVDPLQYPQWVYDRYWEAGIEVEIKKAEQITEYGFDEAWIYNVLQHVDDIRRVISAALNSARIIRIFEWLETDRNEGHINELHAAELDHLFGGVGKVEHMTINPCVGLAYYGIFRGDSYDKLSVSSLGFMSPSTE
jgi:hypothetical protein